MHVKNIGWIAIIATLLFWGCSSPPPKMESVSPEATVQIASVDLSGFNKRIERGNITDFVKILKREGVEILALQKLTRYPGVATRVDVVDEISAQTEWQDAYGETMNISGRSTGNAVLSLYPITARDNQLFDNVKSAAFAGAMIAVVDAGVCPVAVVSTAIPSRASEHDQTNCFGRIAASPLLEKKPAMIVAGNFPGSDAVRNSYALSALPVKGTEDAGRQNIWYTSDSRFHLLSARTIQTGFGPMVIVSMGIYRKR